MDLILLIFTEFVKKPSEKEKKKVKSNNIKKLQYSSCQMGPWIRSSQNTVKYGGITITPIRAPADRWAKI